MLSLTTYVHPKEDPGVTKEKGIGNLFMQMEKCKLQICFSPVLPESPSGGTRSHYWTKIKNRALEATPGPGANKEKSHIVEGPQK